MYKLATTAAVCFFAFILCIIFLADSGGSSIFFDLVKSFPNGDKVGHFFLFGTLTLFHIMASGFKSFSIGCLSVYYGVALVTLFVVLEEISQAFIATRTFDLVDLSADSIGIIVAAAFAYGISRHLRSTAQTN